MGPTFGGVAHVALTVSDMEATAAWCARVLGTERVGRTDEPPDVERHPRILVRHPGSGLVLGLHEPHDRSGDAFDPSRTGLDHVALAVSAREDLDAWSAHLHDEGVTPSPVRSSGDARFVSFSDPDGIAYEVWWPGT